MGTGSSRGIWRILVWIQNDLWTADEENYVIEQKMKRGGGMYLVEGSQQLQVSRETDDSRRLDCRVASSRRPGLQPVNSTATSATAPA